jgi:hypothetical protein
LITELVIQFEKITVNLYKSPNYMKIGHGSDLGIKGLRNLGIEGILSILIN